MRASAREVTTVCGVSPAWCRIQELDQVILSNVLEVVIEEIVWLCVIWVKIHFDCNTLLALVTCVKADKCVAVENEFACPSARARLTIWHFLLFRWMESSFAVSVVPPVACLGKVEAVAPICWAVRDL